MIKTSKELYNHFNKKQKITFIAVVIISIIGSIFELSTIALVFPLITVLFNPESLGNVEILDDVEYFSSISNDEMISITFFTFIVFAVISMFIRIFAIYFSAKFAFGTGHSFSMKAYRSLLYKPYELFAYENSSEAITNIIAKINSIIQNFIFPLTMLIGSLIMLSLALVALVFAATSSKFIFILLFSIILLYLVIILYCKSKLRENSKIIASHQTLQTRSTQEAISGIKDIILTNGYSIYENEFKSIDKTLRERQAFTILIGQSPRYLVETLGIVVILSLAYYMLYVEKSMERHLLLPTFATIAIALQRLLPYINQAYRSWVNISSNLHNLNDILKMLKHDLRYSKVSNLVEKPILFEESITLNNVSFSYDKKNNALTDISFNINKGDKIGFIGATGSGKSTLIDLIMGLLNPHNGQIKVDEMTLNESNIYNWYRLISHVPQNIHLLDGNIYENISFGIDSTVIDKQKVYKMAKLSYVDEFIEQKENSYNENVGERGAKLSGGQKQRIGIARALYKETPIIIFDEATSALDTKTEEKIMENIYNLPGNPTVLMIAHRLSTLKGCDKIVELENGRIKRIGSYQEIIGKING